MNETLVVANGFMLWILSLMIILMVVVQSIIFYRIAMTEVQQHQILTPQEVKKSLKIGVIGTLGPAMAVFAVAVALIAQVGGPLTMARIGVIGSAVFEMIAAKIGSGGTVGTPDFTPSLLASAAWVMTLGGSGWLFMVFFSTRRLDSFQMKMKDTNPLIVSYMASFAPFVIFFTLAYKEVNNGLKVSSIGHLAAVITGFITVLVVNAIVAKKPKLKGLKEWSMGFAVVFALIIGSLLA